MKKKLLLMVVLVGILIVFAGCQNKEITVTDRDGNEVVIGSKLERIISTAPSNTEVLIELGLGDKIVAVDKYSPTEGLSEDIQLIDFRNPDAEVIIGLEPDIIIASGHNKAGVDDPYAVMAEMGISVVYIPSSSSIEGIYEDINFMAMITDTKDKGEAIVEEMKIEIEKIMKISDTITDKKKVYFEIAPAPNIYTMGKGTFQNEMLEIIGAVNIFAEEEGWIAASAEVVAENNPDVILTNVNYIEGAVDEILNREGFEELSAIKNQQVYLVDANATSRPSQYAINGIKEMAKAIYPEYYE